MASKVVGFDELYDTFNRLSGDARTICGRTVYAGGKVAADAVRAAIDKIPKRTKVSEGVQRGIKPQQREGLKAGFGVAKMREENGAYNVALGFDGYNAHKTKAYPGGHANAMIARSIESGTSFLQKTPFIGPAIRSVTGQAEQAMEKAFNEEIKKRSN